MDMFFEQVDGVSYYEGALFERDLKLAQRKEHVEWCSTLYNSTQNPPFWWGGTKQEWEAREKIELSKIGIDFDALKKEIGL